jgi:hypothetical protein
MSTTTTQRKPKAKAVDKGEYKLGVFFKDHKIPNGNAWYGYSNKNQDKNNVSVNRFKALVSRGIFKDKVNWAGIYHLDHLIWEYKDGVWNQR